MILPAQKTLVSALAFVSLASSGVLLMGCPDKNASGGASGSTSTTAAATASAPSTGAAPSASAKAGGGSGW